MKMLPKNTKSNSHFLVLVLVSNYNLRNTDCASVKEFNNPQQQLKKSIKTTSNTKSIKTTSNT